MDNKIFCLETEWTQSVHDMKYESQAKPLLEFLNNSSGIGYTFRQIATKADFDYYINHLTRPSYKDFDIVYLAFHGTPGEIDFPDRGSYGGKDGIGLLDFAQENPGIFEDKTVHFGSCNTLRTDENIIQEFKRLTKAQMITGYRKSVEMTGSFIFELWLLNALYNHPDYRAKRLMDLAIKEMGFFVEKYNFVAF